MRTFELYLTDFFLCRIESRPSNLQKFDFFVDFEGQIGDENVDKLLKSLKEFGVQKLLVLDEKEGMLIFL